MVIRAVRTIGAGEEISENYGPIFTTTPESERKRRLRVQYWFDCSCEACTGHWPLLEELDPTVLQYLSMIITFREFKIIILYFIIFIRESILFDAAFLYLFQDCVLFSSN